MQQRLADWLRLLVAHDTSVPPGDTGPLCRDLAPRLAALGYRVSLHEASPGLVSLVAVLGAGGPQLAFNAHADTVGVDDLAAWHSNPFELAQTDDRLAGLGAVNCKGSLAAQLVVAEDVARRGGPVRGSLSFSVVADEEQLGSSGTGLLRRDGIVRPDYLVVGAPTGNGISSAERGVMWVAIETTGIAAHAGVPETGDSAILRMLRILNRLQTELAPRLAVRTSPQGQATMNIGRIRGGENTNVVPAFCRVEIDRRLTPSENVAEAVEEIRACLEDHATLELLVGSSGFIAPADGALVRELTAAVRHVTGRAPAFPSAVGASDGRHYADDGIEIVTFGPGDGSLGHAANEWVSLHELAEAAMIQLDLVNRLLK